jgi:hypothetical protein
MVIDKKALTREYKETPRPMGVFGILNKTSGVSLVGWSVNLPAILNRHRSELRLNGHRDKEFQRDWNAHGETSFEFQVLDTLDPSDDPAYDPTDDLKLLEQMWIDKLAPLSKRALR